VGRACYWITRSARTMMAGGIVTPRAFAALRLTTSTTLVGSSTGMSPGLAPFRILSTWVALRRNMSNTSAPYQEQPASFVETRQLRDGGQPIFEGKRRDAIHLPRK